MSKESLLESLRFCRKKYGKDHIRTIKAIHNIVKKYPYYEGYEQKWLERNQYLFRK